MLGTLGGCPVHALRASHRKHVRWVRHRGRGVAAPFSPTFKCILAGFYSVAFVSRTTACVETLSLSGNGLIGDLSSIWVPAGYDCFSLG